MKQRRTFFASRRRKTTAKTTATTTLSCMLLLLVTFLKQGIVRTGAAFASTSRGISNRVSSNRLVQPPPSQRFNSLAPPSLSLRERVNGSDSGRNDNKNSQGSSSSSSNQEQKVPETDWNHNLPSESSPFWNGPNQEAVSQRRSQRNGSPTTSRSSEPRTGWLHNTQSSSPPRQAQQTAKAKNKKKVGNMARRRLEFAKLQQERNHRLISTPALHAAGEDRLVAVTEHIISVPLRYATTSNNDPQSQQRIDVYFTIVEKVESEAYRQFLQNELAASLSPRQRADRYVEYAKLETADDMVLYLQGGPGFGAPTPVAGLAASVTGSWAGAALHKHGYHRVVLMDQRGTGHSTAVTKQTLEQKFPDLFLLDEVDDIVLNSRDLSDLAAHDDHDKVQAAVRHATDYLAQFRADHIVLDAEYIREALMVVNLEEEEDDVANDENSRSPKIRPWGCSIGQSYGGFCSMTYMSLVAHPPRIMLLTGGIAPMCSNVYENYLSLWSRCRERSLRYYEQYPSDVPLVRAIVQKLLEAPTPLPSLGSLTARRFLSLGMALGGSPSAFASMHSLLSSAFVGGAAAAAAADRPADLAFTRAFLKRIDSEQSFDDHPIYFWMHETIYADGPNNNVPTNWAAHRAYESKVEEAPDAFDYRRTCKSESEPTLFFGEHVFPWMPEDFAELSGIGLRAVANALATKTDWGPLYDPEHMQMVHVSGRTRSAAAVYHEDMFVDFDACMKVAARNGPLGKCKLYVTNEYQHSGLRDSGAAIFSKLHGMAKGGTQTPS